MVSGTDWTGSYLRYSTEESTRYCTGPKFSELGWSISLGIHAYLVGMQQQQTMGLWSPLEASSLAYLCTYSTSLSSSLGGR